MNEFLPPLYGIEWNTRQVFMRNVHWEPVDLQIWVCLMEYFLLYGVMGWLEASTSLVYSDHNQFWCWMQEIVLPAQEIWFFITHLHARVYLQVNCSSFITKRSISVLLKATSIFYIVFCFAGDLCLEYFLLYGVMRWLAASTSLLFSDHNQFWCWMQEIVLPAQEILVLITHMHVCVYLQVNCFLLHYKKIY
jgi:hypothetical protein